MRGNWHRLLAIGSGVASAAAFMTTIPAVAGPIGSGGGPTAESILGSGSDTTEIMMLHLDGLYTVSEGCQKFVGATKPIDFSCVKPDVASTLHTENYEHDQVHQADFIGSGTGINQLCKQGGAGGGAYIDYARSSRGPGADCTGLHFVAYARDGIGVEAFDDGTAASGIHGMVNPDVVNCPAAGFCLSFAQLKEIYGNPNCNNGGAWIASTWANVGGNAVTMKIYTPQSGSGTRSAFEGFLGVGDSTACIAFWGQSVPLQSGSVPENQNSAIETNGDKNTFIFPFSFAIWSTEINNTAVPGYFLSKINNLTISTASIADSSWPMTRFVYNVFCAVSTGSCADTTTFSKNHVVTQKTADYIGEEGWICKLGANEPGGATWLGRVDMGVPTMDNDPANSNAKAPHHISPHYGRNWGDIITTKIGEVGFGRLSIDVIGSTTGFPPDTNSDHCRLANT